MKFIKINKRITTPRNYTQKDKIVIHSNFNLNTESNEVDNNQVKIGNIKMNKLNLNKIKKHDEDFKLTIPQAEPVKLKQEVNPQQKKQ